MLNDDNSLTMALLALSNKNTTSGGQTLLGRSLTPQSMGQTILGGSLSSRIRWSSRFETWAKPLSDTEDQKCQNAENIVRSALKGHDELEDWPDETHANGVAKNKRTGNKYKKVVRVIKGLRNEMDEKGIESAKKISSFQISCLAYNINAFYGKDDLYDNVKGVVGSIWFHTTQSGRSANWTEVDEIKLLFPQDQPNKRKEVAAFFWDVIQYAELNNAELKG